MKKIVFLLVGLSIFVVGCKQNPFVKKGIPTSGLPTSILKDTTTIQFDVEKFDFGTIAEGEKVSHVFHVKNTGDKNLIIANAFGSCGCTVPEYPKEPIAPGATGDINVTFNSTGKEGDQNKSVTLQVNTAKHNEMIYMVGKVLPGEKVDSTKK